MVEQRIGHGGLKPVTLGALSVIILSAPAILGVSTPSAPKIIPHFSDVRYFTKISSSGKYSWRSNKNRFLNRFFHNFFVYAINIALSSVVKKCLVQLKKYTESWVFRHPFSFSRFLKKNYEG